MADKRTHAGADLETVPGHSHASHLFQRVDMRLAHASSGFAVAAEPGEKPAELVVDHRVARQR